MLEHSLINKVYKTQHFRPKSNQI